MISVSIFFHCFPADEAYFLIQNYPHQICLYYTYSNRVGLVRQGTCNYNNSKHRWIWTNNGQLLNRKSLKCMADNHVTADKTHFIVMNKCDKNNAKQLLRCERVHHKNYIKTKKSNRYLRDGEYLNYVTAGHVHWSVASEWARHGSLQDVCFQGKLILNLTNIKTV